VGRAVPAGHCRPDLVRSDPSRPESSDAGAHQHPLHRRLTSFPVTGNRLSRPTPGSGHSAVWLDRLGAIGWGRQSRSSLIVAEPSSVIAAEAWSKIAAANASIATRSPRCWMRPPARWRASCSANPVSRLAAETLTGRHRAYASPLKRAPLAAPQTVRADNGQTAGDRRVLGEPLNADLSIDTAYLHCGAARVSSPARRIKSRKGGATMDMAADQPLCV
jgi:hypothetical protein